MTSEFVLSYRFRVRYAEVDAQSVAFNSRYLEYADVVFTEYLRSVGVPVCGPDTFEMQVVEANVRYLRPLRFDDECEGWIRVARMGRSSASFDIELRLSGATEPNACIALHYVHVDLNAGRSMEIPARIRSRFLSGR